MKHSKRTLTATAAAALLAGSTAITACGSDDRQNSPDTVTKSFPAESNQLMISNEFGRLDVRHADTDVITVERKVTTAGREPSEPVWDLRDSTLTLASACGEGYVGLCEPTYTVTVPTDINVTTVDPQSR